MAIISGSLVESKHNQSCKLSGGDLPFTLNVVVSIFAVE